ncbi:MAG: NAD-dependent epimerase/dehydratase family protein [Nitrosospira sp.]
MSTPSSPYKIIVTGATSMIGHFVLPRLLDAGYEVHAISRTYSGNPNMTYIDATDKGMFWHQVDISHAEQLPHVNAQMLIHLAPLWLLPPLLPVMNSLQIKRIIGFGSTSLFSKANSADAGERQLVARFSEVEEAISRFCEPLKINWTVFRPTLVYDCVRDKNITLIAQFIQRFGFFPLLGKAAGLRQPVYADDLAAACLMALNQPATFDKAYNMSGGETLSYRQMVERIFGSLGKPVRFLVIPSWLFRWAIRIITLFPGKRHMTPEMAIRMNADLCFDHADATRDFGFLPRMFFPCWRDAQK